MITRLFFISILLCVTFSFSETTNFRRLVLIGDSTVSDYPPNLAPLTGWGQALREQLKTQVNVANYAVPGSSSSLFYNKYWKNVLSNVKAGDCLLIQFGHIDALPDLDHHVDLDTYRSNLIKFINESRLVAGVQPILVTSISQYHFVHRQVANKHSDYHSVMKNVAHEMRVPIIDLAFITAKSMEILGEDKSRSWFMIYHDGHDIVHLNQNGAQAIAAIIASNLNNIGCSKRG